GIGLYSKNIIYSYEYTGTYHYDYYFNGDNSGTSTSLGYPAGITLDASGNLIVTDTNNQRIRKINLLASGNPVTTIAGIGWYATTTCGHFTCSFGCSCDYYNYSSWGFNGDGTATSKALYYPYSPAVDSSSRITFADSNNQRVRRFPAGGSLETIAGDGNAY